MASRKPRFEVGLPSIGTRILRNMASFSFISDGAAVALRCPMRFCVQSVSPASLIAQRIDRFQTRRLVRRIETEEYADRGGYEKGEQDCAAGHDDRDLG